MKCIFFHFHQFRVQVSSIELELEVWKEFLKSLASPTVSLGATPFRPGVLVLVSGAKFHSCVITERISAVPVETPQHFNCVALQFRADTKVGVLGVGFCIVHVHNFDQKFMDFAPWNYAFVSHNNATILIGWMSLPVSWWTRSRPNQCSPAMFPKPVLYSCQSR